MCGRYVTPDQAAIERVWQLGRQNSNPFKRRFNAAPTQMMPIVRLVDGKLELTPARWGLIPAWSKDFKIAYSTINARAETVATKPAFRAAYKARRCIVPASGYYEWKEMSDGKQPYYFQHQAAELLALAGLWETWRPKEGEPVTSYTIIVGEANKMAAEFHDRMPVILDPQDWTRWLAGTAGADVMKPCSVELLEMFPVSRRVNSVKNDDPSLIERIELPVS